jgi:hypothetical protein
MISKIDSSYIQHDGSRVCQGDIFRDWKYDYRIYSDEKGTLSIEKIDLPYMIVLSQDCDLEGDFKNRNNPDFKNDDILEVKHDKFLHSILVCPAYLSEQLKQGTHLQRLGFTMEIIGTNKWNDIKNNTNPRYHFLMSHLKFQIPDLAIDFKHYFTIPRDKLYETAKNHYIASVNELFRESLSQRFAYYLSRVGLPELTNQPVNQ